MSIIDLEPALEKPIETRGPALRHTRQAGLAILALWILTSVYLVAPEQQAVVTRFGAVVEPRVTPGIHLSLPWPIDSVTKLKVQQLQRLGVGGGMPGGI